MKPNAFTSIAILFTLLPAVAPAAEPSAHPLFKPYGIANRTLWSTSRVIGSPEPPPPYRVKRTLPKLQVKQPLSLYVEPGTASFLLIQHLGSWSGPARILRFEGSPDVDKTETLLDIDGVAYGLAFHPQYAKNGYVYIGSNRPTNGKPKHNRVSRYTIERQAPFRLDPKSEVVILEWASDGHNGCDLAFGPDGMLYISTGDGTSDSDTNDVGQSMNDLLAAMLRIDVDHPVDGKPYSIPKDNPFLDLPGACPEIWAYGFRNPWRITFDSKTGHLWVGQNGQDQWEQVILCKKGENYGWSVMEGGYPFQLQRKRGPTPIVKPVVDHPHSEARSLTGGVVYHGASLPELTGAYIYGDWSTGKIWGLKHDGAKLTWHKELTDTTLQITGFALDHQGELLVIDHGTGFYRLEPTPAETAPSNFPRKLSETGLFTSTQDYRPDPALIPYSVNAPLWSDGAIKDRFIALPGDTHIDFGTGRGWNCPEGTVLVKSFSLELEAGNPASRRRVETRLLTKQQNEWIGYSYQWNDEQTDAVLVELPGKDQIFTIRDPAVASGTKQQTWHFPSRTECMVCHSRAANYVLGLTELQMNKLHDYGGVVDQQLRTLEHLGVLRVNIREHEAQFHRPFVWVEERLKSLLNVVAPSPKKKPTKEPLSQSIARSIADRLLIEPVRKPWRDVRKAIAVRLERHPIAVAWLPKRPEEYRSLADPSDSQADLDRRARSYLHANCSQCHVEAGGGNALMELEFTATIEKLRLFDIRPQHHTFGLPDARLVAPGKPESSVLLKRLSHRGQGQMPPLATSIADREGIELLTEWIRKMPNPPK